MVVSLTGRASAQLECEPALYLLGRPLLFQELVPDQVENALVVEHAPPAARLPPLGVAPLRGRGAVEPLARVALELARHRRLAAPDGAGYPEDAPPVASHQHDVLARLKIHARKTRREVHGQQLMRAGVAAARRAVNVVEPACYALIGISAL